MSDVIDHDGLYLLAESQAGYFTAQQALAAGMDRSTLRHHARPGGRYQRVRRDHYRLRHFPSSLHEHMVAAWLTLQNSPAIISHESALELYELSDVISPMQSTSRCRAPNAANAPAPASASTPSSNRRPPRTSGGSPVYR